MKMEQTGCTETSAYKIQAPWNYLEEIVKLVLVLIMDKTPTHALFYSTLY